MCKFSLRRKILTRIRIWIRIGLAPWIRIRIRIRIEVKSWIRIRFEVKSWIQIPIETTADPRQVTGNSSLLRTVMLLLPLVKIFPIFLYTGTLLNRCGCLKSILAQ